VQKSRADPVLLHCVLRVREAVCYR